MLQLSRHQVATLSQFPQNNNNEEVDAARPTRQLQQSFHPYSEPIPASATSGLRFQDPTQADDGYFLHPSDPLILANATDSRVYDADTSIENNESADGADGNQLRAEQNLGLQTRAKDFEAELDADLEEAFNEYFPPTDQVEENTSDDLDSLFDSIDDENEHLSPVTTVQNSDRATPNQATGPGCSASSSQAALPNELAPTLHSKFSLTLPTALTLHSKFSLPLPTASIFHSGFSLTLPTPPTITPSCGTSLDSGQHQHGQSQPEKPQSESKRHVHPTDEPSDERPKRAKRRRTSSGSPSCSPSGSPSQDSPIDGEFFGRSFDPDAVITSPSAKRSRYPGLPPASEVPALFEMSRLTFTEFEMQIKQFMLDPTHPERLQDGLGNLIYKRKKAPTNIDNMGKYALEILNSGLGERYYGVNSDGPSARTLSWPQAIEDIVEKMHPLLRKICKNESQRRYAQNKRGADKAATEEESKGDTHACSCNGTSESVQSLPTTPDRYSAPVRARLIQFHVHFVRGDQFKICVQPKLILKEKECHTYMDMVNFINKNMPENHRFVSLWIHGPSGLQKAADHNTWHALVRDAYLTDWLERDLRCIAQLELVTQPPRQLSETEEPEVVVID